MPLYISIGENVPQLHAMQTTRCVMHFDLVAAKGDAESVSGELILPREDKARFDCVDLVVCAADDRRRGEGALGGEAMGWHSSSRLRACCRARRGHR